QGSGFHHAQRGFVDQVIGGRGAFALAQQGNVEADEIGGAQRFVQRGVTNGGSLAADATLEGQIFHFLDGLDVFVVFIRGIEAQDVHVESRALLDEGLADASGADYGYSFSGDFVAQKGQVGVPVAPAIFAGEMFGGPEFAGERAHQEEGKLSGRFGQDVGGIREWDFVFIGIGAIDVVKAYGVLCYHFWRAFSGGDNLGVDRIAQRGDQGIHGG